MTCIVAIADGAKVCMGADSAGVSGWDLTVRRDPKMFRVGSALIGYTSSFRMGQLLGFSLELPKRHPDTDLFRWMVTDFVDAVRASLKAGGYAAVNNNREEGGEFLVGIEGRVFKIAADFQVGEAATGYDACGCGAAYALGAVRNSRGMATEMRIIAALETAEEFSAGVRGPFAIATQEDARPGSVRAG